MDLPPIRSTHNRQVSLVRRLLTRPKDARLEGVLVADGIHLVQEAIRAGLGCRALFITADERSPEITAILAAAGARRLPVYRVLEHLFRGISHLETPQGVIGVFERPRPGLPAPRNESGSPPGHLVVAHGLQDPVNIGSLSRSALGAGVLGLVTTPGTVDPFHHRALRAAQGASFFLPHLLDQPPIALAERLQHDGYLVVGLSADGDHDLTDLDPARPTAVFLGSEGSGLDPDVLGIVSRRVRIPIEPGVESLGVAAAGAVAMFWLRLARRG
jgi:RNA methyltransferase, TrmH family